MSTNNAHAVLLLNIAIILLGIAGLFAKWITLPAFVIIGGRSVVAMVFLGVCCVVMKQWQGWPKRADLALFGGVGVLMMLHWVFFYQSVQVSSVAIGVISIYTYPLMSAFLDPFLSGSAINRRHVIEGVLVVLAMGILSFHRVAVGNVILGIGYGLLGAFFFALRNSYSKRLAGRYPAMMIMWVQVAVTSLCLLPFSGPALLAASSQNLLLTVAAGIIVSGIGHTLFIKSLEWLSATTVGIIASFQIVIAALLAWWLLGETPSLAVGIGGSLILAVVIYEQRYMLTTKHQK